MTTPSSTRWRVPPAAWVPISIGILAETTSNGLRAYALGTQLSRFSVDFHDVTVSLAGVVLVFAAAAVSLSQSRAFWVTFAPGVQMRQRLICGIAAGVLITVSITAMAGHVLEANRAKGSNETDIRETYDRAKKAYDDAVGEANAVKGAKTPGEIEAEAEAAGSKIDANIWRRSMKCTEATTRASIEECRSVTQIRTKLAEAKRKAELEAKLPGLKSDLDRLHRPEKAGLAEDDVAAIWAWLIAISVVGLATAGPVLFAVSVTEKPVVPGNSVYLPANPVPANDPIPRNPAPSPPPKGGRRGRKASAEIMQFSEAFSRKHGRAPSGSEIRAEFPELPVSTAYDYAYRARSTG